MTPSFQAQLLLKRGSLYLSAELYERYLKGAEAVSLVRRDTDLLILPMQNVSLGGYQLRVRTVTGDRVIHASDFFRAQGIGEEVELDLPVSWSDADTGLAAPRVFLF